MSFLTITDLSAIVPGDLSRAEVINLGKRSLKDIESLSSCKQLKRIELYENELENLEFLGLNLELRWIDAQKNCIGGYFKNYLNNLQNLTVLNLSHNELENVDAIFNTLPNLKSLVLTSNKIRCIEGLAKLQQLETLILSHNELTTFPLPKREMPNLKKLSLGHNKLLEFSLNVNIFNIRELRLNSNRLTQLPQDLYCASGLEILDLGKNNITASESQCTAVFRRNQHLKSLNLAGNDSICQTSEEWDNFGRVIFSARPSLTLFNSRPIEVTQKQSKRQLKKDSKEKDFSNNKELSEENKPHTIRCKKKRSAQEAVSNRESTNSVAAFNFDSVSQKGNLHPNEIEKDHDDVHPKRRRDTKRKAEDFSDTSSVTDRGHNQSRTKENKPVESHSTITASHILNTAASPFSQTKHESTSLAESWDS